MSEDSKKNTYGFEPCPWCGYTNKYGSHKVRVFNRNWLRKEPFVRIQCPNCGGTWDRQPKEPA